MYISEEQIRTILTYEALIPAIRQALIEYSSGKVDQPLRSVLRVKDENSQPSGWFAVMPVVAGDFMAVKTVTFFPGNSILTGAEALPTHLATIELLSRVTGQPLAVMDGRLITEMRTAAVSAVAVEALAPSARTLGVLGSGVQARSHIEALRQVCPAFREPGSVRIWSRDPEKADALAAETRASSTTIEEAADSDVVLTVTGATEPILRGEWLSSTSLVVAVGAVGPHLRELDDEVMAATLIAESRQGVENESGDVLLSGAKVYAEIGEILSGAIRLPPGRRVFKSLGMAIEDLTGAVHVWNALQLAAASPRGENSSTSGIIHKINLPVSGLEHLLSEANQEGINFLETLTQEWSSGENRFEGPGEILYGYFDRGLIVAVGGLNLDHFANDPKTGRIRRLYVRPSWRNKGLGRALVSALVAYAGSTFEMVRLRAKNADAARLYERMGFSPLESPDATHLLHLGPARSLVP